MREFFHSPPLRLALLASLILHLFTVGWIAGWTRADPPADLESLRLVEVDPVSTPPVKEEAALPLQKKEKSIPSVKKIVRRLPPKPRKNTISSSQRRKISDKNSAVQRVVRSLKSRSKASSQSHPKRIAANKKIERPDLHPLKNNGGSLPIEPEGANSEPEDEEVPDGPTDLIPEKGEEGAAQLSEITKGSMIQSNPNFNGEVITALVRVPKSFSGPGVFYSVPLTVPESAPPGTVYRLELVEVVIADGEARPVSFTIVPGSLTILPTKAVLPPPEQPTLTGNMVGVGKLYAHRGMKLKVDVYGGDGLTEIGGVQAKLVFKNVEIPPRKTSKKKPTTPSEADKQKILSP